MTYLSQFPNAKLVKNAPLRNKTDPKKARAYGKGVTATGNKVSGGYIVEVISSPPSAEEGWLCLGPCSAGF